MYFHGTRFEIISLNPRAGEGAVSVGEAGMFASLTFWGLVLPGLMNVVVVLSGNEIRVDSFARGGQVMSAAWRPIQRPEAAAGDRWEGDGVLKAICGSPPTPRKGGLPGANTAVATAAPDPPGVTKVPGHLPEAGPHRWGPGVHLH